MLNEDTRTKEEIAKDIEELKKGVKITASTVDGKLPLEGPKHYQIVNIGSITWAKVADEDIHLRTVGCPEVIHLDKDDELFFFYKEQLNKLRSTLASGLVVK